MTSASSEGWVNNCQPWQYWASWVSISAPWNVTLNPSTGMELSLGKVISVTLFGFLEQLKIVEAFNYKMYPKWSNSGSSSLPNPIKYKLLIWFLRQTEMALACLTPPFVVLPVTLALGFVFWVLVLLSLKLNLWCMEGGISLCDCILVTLQAQFGVCWVFSFFQHKVWDLHQVLFF